LVTNHVVNINSLLANREYFYQVTSRDAAGNTTTDTNLYSFSTQRAPQPPWTDDLEKGAAGWSVVPDSGTVMNWSLGTPNNGLQTSAASGTNAWGSNLHGDSLGAFEVESSFLYSPIIDLSGFSSATLTFSHCYDFSYAYTFAAQLGISTDTSTKPVDIPTLVDYGGLSAYDWEPATVDLTPFIGKTIQVVWYYAVMGDGSGPVDGWLLDDVSITGVAGGGTIVVSKNLGQGSFTLSGLISQSGNAPLTTISNAPPGPYTVQFSDVAFYQTPLDQSNTLTNGGTLTFTGNYEFIDANYNGTSDSWERYFFGSATTNRTQFTDSDGDGMPDYAEFNAGTNPTNAASKLVLLGATPQTNQLVQLTWAAIPGRLYQVQTSGTTTNLQDWTPISDWLLASGSPMHYTTTSTNQGLHLYRVQVRP
jgi:hypothetical protein